MQFRTTLALTISLLVPCNGLNAAQVQQATHGGTGVIYGRFVAANCACGMPYASVYAMTMNQSKRPRGIEEEAYARAHAPGVDENHAESIEWNDLDRLVDLIPRLPRVAMTKSDRKGRYVLRGLPAGQRYYIVAFYVGEDGENVAAGITPVIKDGEELRFNLSDNVPWEERFKIKPRQARGRTP